MSDLSEHILTWYVVTYTVIRSKSNLVGAVCILITVYLDFCSSGLIPRGIILEREYVTQFTNFQKQKLL